MKNGFKDRMLRTDIIPVWQELVTGSRCCQRVVIDTTGFVSGDIAREFRFQK